MTVLPTWRSRCGALLRPPALTATIWWLRTRRHRDGLSPTELALLRFGWGNPTWAATPDYLRLVVAAVQLTDGPIVEAGSGLTTIVLDAVAPPGRQVISFEHDEGWAARVRDRLGPGGPTVLVRPLVPGDDFDWYGVEPGDLPADIGLVLVDGPPGTTRGGRYGALPVLAPWLRQGSILLVDDAGRVGERAVLDAWKDRFGVDEQLLELPARSAARVIVTDAARLDGAR